MHIPVSALQGAAAEDDLEEEEIEFSDDEKVGACHVAGFGACLQKHNSRDYVAVTHVASAVTLIMCFFLPSMHDRQVWFLFGDCDLLHDIAACRRLSINAS